MPCLNHKHKQYSGCSFGCKTSLQFSVHCLIQLRFFPMDIYLWTLWIYSACFISMHLWFFIHKLQILVLSIRMQNFVEFQELSFLLGICHVSTKSPTITLVTINKYRDRNCNPRFFNLFWKERADSEKKTSCLDDNEKMVQHDLSKLLPPFLTISSTYHCSHFSTIKNKHYLFMLLSACTELSQVVTVIYIPQVTYWWKHTHSTDFSTHSNVMWSTVVYNQPTNDHTIV